MKVWLRDKSGTRLYRFLVEDIDRHGNVRVYFRRKGQPKIRLFEMPGTPAFDAEYHRAFNGEVKLPSASQHTAWMPGTLGWLCEQYYVSGVFQALDKSTRKNRRGILEAICERRIDGQRVGTFRYATMEPRHVAKLRDEKTGFPEAANHRLKALRQLFAWACLPAYRDANKNPARDVTYLQSNNPDGIPAWSEADAARYEARHPIGTKARLAFDLLLYTGVRRSDAVRLGPQMERDGKLVFSELKGRSRIVKTHELPILPPLRRSIDATQKQIGHLVYLVAASGQPQSAHAFGCWFIRRCREAGLARSAHGLRKLGAQRCAEAGASEHQLMALFGWANPKQAALYTKKANRAKLEAAAAPLLEAPSSNAPGADSNAAAERDSNESVPLFARVPAGGTVRPKKA